MAAPALHTPVGILVAERPSRADVFDRFGIDYCCGGKLSIRWFCEKKGLDAQAVIQAIEVSDRAPVPEAATDWQQAPLDALASHITTTHHRYLREALPTMAELVEEVASVHGPRHPELYEIAARFPRFREEMIEHLDQEEQVVFPLIIRLERGLGDVALGRRFLSQQLAKMEVEHTAAGGDLETMARLTGNFAVPEGGCGSYRALMGALAELVADTHRHVHKENSILFVRAAALLDEQEWQEAANRGEIVAPEQHAAIPLRDMAAEQLTHRGGQVSARAELY